MTENQMDVIFCRKLLSLTHADVRKAWPQVRVSDAWVYRLDRQSWEFHFGAFYWHGRAANAYDARAKGWAAYLRANKVPGYVINDNEPGSAAHCETRGDNR